MDPHRARRRAEQRARRALAERERAPARVGALGIEPDQRSIQLVGAASDDPIGVVVVGEPPCRAGERAQAAAAPDGPGDRRSVQADRARRGSGGRVHHGPRERCGGRAGRPAGVEARAEVGARLERPPAGAEEQPGTFAGFAAQGAADRAGGGDRDQPGEVVEIARIGAADLAGHVESGDHAGRVDDGPGPVHPHRPRRPAPPAPTVPTEHDGRVGPAERGVVAYGDVERAGARPVLADRVANPVRARTRELERRRQHAVGVGDEGDHRLERSRRAERVTEERF